MREVVTCETFNAKVAELESKINSHSHPIPEPVELEVCTGPFHDITGRTGWILPQAGYNTENTGTVVDDWVQVSTPETSPDCATDASFFIDGGVLYHNIVNVRSYHWLSFRVLVDGVPVITNTYDSYQYLDERVNTLTGDEPLQTDARDMKVWMGSRNNIPAGSTITFEIQRRYNHNGFQDGGRVRTLGGLRSKAHAIYTPREIVTGAL